MLARTLSDRVKNFVSSPDFGGEWSVASTQVTFLTEQCPDPYPSIGLRTGIIRRYDPVSRGVNRRGTVDRRTFMKLSSGAALMGAAGIGCGKGSGISMPGDLGVGAWGQVPPEYRSSVLLPGHKTPEAMLEIFCLGGVTPWESFYTIPEYCDPTKGGDYAGQQWWNFQKANWISVPEWFSECGGGDRPLIEPFGLDAAGMMVNLGPFIWPLRDRPDILKRMRIWVMHHDVEPHAVAIPFAVAGHGVGNPRMAGLGTHLNRYFQDHDPSNRPEPFAYSLFMSSFDRSNNGTASAALGLHPASARSTVVQLGKDPRLPKLLPRPATVGYRYELDALVRYYAEQFREELKVSSLGDLRNPGLKNYLFARDAMENHEALANMLPAELMQSEYLTMCQPDPTGPVTDIYDMLDETSTGMQLARHLITHPDTPARYVQLMDAGIFTDPQGQGYDAHAAHVLMQGPNLRHMTDKLCAIINKPGEDDPNKLDLDKHFVLINSEFGRAPYAEFTPANPNGDGTNHWPQGYVVVGFGAFADEERSGVVGAIGENSVATYGTTPTEHRAAMLLAMGVWPFTAESFAVGDIRGVNSEIEAALKLRKEVLGYGS